MQSTIFLMPERTLIRTIYENNRQKPPFVPNSAKSGFLSSYFRSKEPCGSLFRQILFVLQAVPDVLDVIVILQRVQQLAHQLQLIGVGQAGGGHGHHGQIIGQDLVALLFQSLDNSGVGDR